MRAKNKKLSGKRKHATMTSPSVLVWMDLASRRRVIHQRLERYSRRNQHSTSTSDQRLDQCLMHRNLTELQVVAKRRPMLIIGKRSTSHRRGSRLMSFGDNRQYEEEKKVGLARPSCIPPRMPFSPTARTTAIEGMSYVHFTQL